MGDLPNGWSETTLTNLITHVLGGDWGLECISDMTEECVEVNVIRGTEFKSWEREKGSSAVIRLVKEESLRKRRLEKGDIVLEVSGGGPTQPVGRTVLIDEEALKKSHLPLICSNFFRQIRFDPLIDPAFINYSLDYLYNLGCFNEYQSQTTNLRNLNFNHFVENVILQIAPFSEQRKISLKLDKLFRKLKNCKERLDKIPVIIKRFRQSVLTAACSGRLTVDWREKNPNVEPLLELLKRIKERKNIHYQASEIKNWTKIMVKDVFNSFSGGTPSKNNSDYWNGQIPWISSGDVKRDKIEQGTNFITQKGLENSSAKICLPYSIIIVVRSGVLKHTLPLSVVQNPLAINQDIKCFDSGNKDINFWLFLNLKAFQSHILALNREGTTVQSVKYDTLKNLQINIPPISEQKEIVRRVETLFKIADQIEERYQRTKVYVDKLTQSILAKAFRGELVPHDPNDEPASVLLERLKEKRAKEDLGLNIGSKGLHFKRRGTHVVK